MNLSSLLKTTEHARKRIGRGIGSGKGGHTVGRGSKGQKARGKMSPYFEGASAGASLIKRLPLLRGNLNLLPPESIVDLESLIKHKIVDEHEARTFGVKILGEGELKVPLVIKLPHSKAVEKKITAFIIKKKEIIEVKKTTSRKTSKKENKK